MSIYISPNNDYPRHIGDIQLDNPDYVEGTPLPSGWVKVELTDLPTVKQDQTWTELFPVETDGVFYQAFEVRNLTADELEARKIAEVKRKVANGLTLTEAEAALLVG